MLRDYDLIASPVFVDARGGEHAEVRGEMAHAAAVLVATGSLSRGFRLAASGLAIFAETDVFEEESVTTTEAAAAGAIVAVMLTLVPETIRTAAGASVTVIEPAGVVDPVTPGLGSLVTVLKFRSFGNVTVRTENV